VGIRPENFEDAALVSAGIRSEGITFHATIDVLESLGSDVYVYFTKELAQGVDAAELRELAQDSGRDEAGVSGDTVVARLDVATAIREGQDAELWMDMRALHLFDPATGQNLSLEADVRGGQPPAAQADQAPAVTQAVPEQEVSDPGVT
jgi:multiple sugar transport system ATP-binding protein